MHANIQNFLLASTGIGKVVQSLNNREVLADMSLVLPRLPGNYLWHSGAPDANKSYFLCEPSKILIEWVSSFKSHWFTYIQAINRSSCRLWCRWKRNSSITSTTTTLHRLWPEKQMNGWILMMKMMKSERTDGAAFVWWIEQIRVAGTTLPVARQLYTPCCKAAFALICGGAADKGRAPILMHAPS